MGILVDVDTEVDFPTPRGRAAFFFVRPSTTDALTALACCQADEYSLPHDLTGWALDVGAHIGGATIALLLDNPELHVVAIEPLPENVELLRRNLERNRVADRCEVIEGAAGENGRVAYGTTETAFAAEHRFIGNGDWHDGLSYVDATPVRLADLHRAFAFMKIDCEGGEWSFLDDDAIADVEVIAGEFHSRDGHGAAYLRELLEPTHVVRVDDTLHTGPFRAWRA